MHQSDQPATQDSKSGHSPNSLSETIHQATQAVEQSRAQIARSQALGRSVADLVRALDDIAQEQDASGAKKDTP
jgi:hypothetical protein